MIALLLNLLLAIAWAALGGSASAHNLVLGFALGALALFLVREPFGSQELALSAVKVATTVLSRDMNLKPGIFAFPLTVDRDFEITLLANMITLTPGTLSVDVSDDKKTLYVHALDCADPDAIRRDIANGFERKIMEAFR
jgi:multicomponent Na+:H+ antiporter subunit E